MTRLVRLVTLAICLGWAAALALPALQLGEQAPLTGWYVLTNGWRATGAGVWAWFANPLFICAVVLLLLRRERSAGVLATLALLLGFSSLATGPLAARSGYSLPALTFGPGFHLWLICLFALCSWTWVISILKKKQWKSC